ncbi:MAG TPA: STAS domain-containing protein [Candidatus Acidoferrum sp.]|jgi:anti-sigma B factor antagonist
MALHATYRDSGDVTVLDMGGRIVLGDGSALLRNTVKELLNDNRTKILINLADVNYIDSSGIGELVQAYTSVKNRGGELKLLHLTKKVHDILQITKLYTVFDVYSDEATAVRSF